MSSAMDGLGLMPIRNGFSGTATVTHIQGEDKWLRLWVQLSNNNLPTIKKVLSDLAPKLLESRGFLHQCQIPLQSRVIFCSTHDSQWYRGVVINWLPGNSPCDVGVQLTDYGRLEYVDVNMIRRMDEPQYQVLSSIPPCATECWLADAWPNGGIWSQDAVEMAIRFVTMNDPVKIIGIGLIESQPMIRVLSESNGMSLSNILVQHSYALATYSQQAMQTISQQSMSPLGQQSMSPLGQQSISPLGQQSMTPLGQQPMYFRPTPNIIQPVVQSPCYSCLNLEMGTVYRVVVSHVEGPHLFFVQLMNRETQKYTLNQNITAHVNSSNVKCLQNLNNRTPCLAYLAKGNAYARALILHANGDGQTFTVHFVDIGCSEKKPYGELLAIPPELMIEHVLAYECQLQVTLPEPTLLPQVVAGKILDCQLLRKNGNRLVVNLSYNGRDISDLCRIPTMPPIETRVSSVRGVIATQLAPFEFTPIVLSRDFKFQAVITHVKDSTEFYGQINENGKDIQEQLISMNEFYSTSQNELSERQCFPGATVAAPYSVDGNWYRAEVKLSSGEGVVDVTFVDYGNCQSVAIRDLRQLHTAYQVLPKQAICMSLNGLEQIRLNAKLSEIFLNQIEDKELIVEVKDIHNQTYSVNLYTIPGSQLINKQFIEAVNKVTIKPPTLAHTESLYVTIFNTVEDFFGQLTKFPEDDFALFCDELHNYYNSLPQSSGQYQVGDLVACKFSENETFYRATVSRISNQQADIFYVDFGNRDTVNVSQLFPLTHQFARLPQQGILCSFSKESLKGMSKEKFSALQGSTIEVKVVGSSDLKHEVELTRSEVNADFLSTAKEQSSSVSLAKPAIKIGSKHEVVVVDMHQNGDFICQLQADIQKLQDVMAELDEYYKNIGAKDLSLRASTPGTFCVAKYNLDDSWYRAEIKSMQDNTRNVTVLFVDYGNIEEVSPGEVKALVPDFAVLSQQIFTCQFPNVSSSFWTNQNIEKAKTVLFDPVFTAHIKGQSPNTPGVFTVDLLDSEGNNVGDQLTKTSAKTVNQQSVPVNNYSTSDDWDEGPTGTKPNYKNPAVQVNNYSASDDWNESKSDAKPNYGERTSYKKDSFNNNRDNSRNDSQGKSYLFRNDDDNESFDKPRGRFGGRDNSNERPKRNFNSDSTDWRNKGASNRDGDNQGGRFGQSGGDDSFRSNNRERKPWENKGSQRDGYQKSDSGFSGNKEKPWERDNSSSTFQKRDSNYSNSNDNSSFNDSATSFGPKSKVNSPAKSNPQVKPFGSFLELRPRFVADATVVHAVSPGEFYCHLTDNSATVMTLLESMDECYSKMNEGQFTLLDKSKNAVCCAQSSEDSAWYRARVQENKGGFIEVLFVDYGNKELVPENKVKELKKEFHSLPIQAIKCALMNVHPEGTDWDPSDVNTFRERIMAQSIVIRLQESLGEGSYLIQIVESNELERIMEGLAHTTVETKVDPLSHRNLVPGVKLQPTTVDIGSTELVEITWVDKPNLVKCHLKSTVTTFKTMMEEMQNYYSQLPDNVGLVKPVVGMFCVAQFSEDNAWYRCKVMEVKGGKLQVYYVDYGNSEEVTRHCVRCLATNFSSTPCLALKCEIKGLSVLRDVEDHEVENMYSGEFTCSFLDKNADATVVQLLSASGKDLAAELVNSGICIYGEAQPEGAYPLPVLPTGLIDVYVSHVNSLDSIFVHLVSQGDALNAVTEALETRGSQCPALPAPSVGVACIAKFSEDEAYYRAVVAGLKDEEAEVLFVDFGNTDKVHPSTLLEVPVDLLSKAPFAFACSLAGVSSVESSEADVLSLFNELTQDKDLKAALTLGGRLDAAYSIVLSDQEGNIKQRLLDSGFAMEVKDPAPKAQTTGVQKFLLPGIPSKPETCYVSHVLGIQNIFLQLASQESALNDMATLLDTEMSNDNPSQMTNPVIGAACCAQFSEDCAWYRAQIVSLEGEKATVSFIDYGNCDTVDVNALKTVSAKFLSIPPYALNCQLGRLVPVSGQEENAVELFKTLTQDKELTGSFSRSLSVIQVNLTSEEDGDLAKKILEAGLVSEVEAQVEDQVVQRFPLPVIPKEPELCYVCQVSSIQNFYLQLSSQENALTDQAGQLESLIADNQLQDLTSAVIGGACCAQFSEDAAWYRAQILSVEGTKATVLFVDYGNCDTVNVNNLKKLNGELISVPPYALNCCLGNLSTSSGHEQDAVDLFNSLTEEKTLTAVFKEMPSQIQVQLSTEEDGSLNKKLIESGFASSVDVPVQQESALKFCQPVVPSQPEECFISQMSSIQNFYLQLAKQETTLSEMSSNLYTQMSNGQGQQLACPVVGGACCAQFTEDEAWYRAQILSLEGDKASVLFVDYGNCDTVDVSNLKKVSEDLISVPPYALNCCLGNLNTKVGCEQEAADLFNSLTEEKTLRAVFKEMPAPMQVQLSTEEDGDLNEKLIESGFACVVELPVTQEIAQTFGQPNVPSDPEACFVSHVSSIQNFYLQLASQETALSELAADLEAQMSGGQGQQLTSPVVGGACCAQFSEDEAWYRAEILSLEGDQATVLFVDYGNCDIVDINTLKIASDQFLSVLPYALKCQLGKVSPVCGHEQEALNLFKSLTEEKELTAIFRGTPSTLEVELCSEDGDVGKQLVESGFATEVEYKRPSTLPPVVVPAEPVKCFATNVASVYSIHLQMASDEEAVGEMAEHLREAFSEDKGEKLQNPSVGMVCGALYSEDDSWYRAQITATEDAQATVKFVDYGNCATVPLDSLKILPENLFTLPPFAFDCRLGNLVVVPDGEEEATKLLDSLVQEKELTCTFSGTPSAISVVFSTEDNSDIATALLESGLVVKEQVIEQNVDEGLKQDGDIIDSEVPVELVQEVCAPVSAVSPVCDVSDELVQEVCEPISAESPVSSESPAGALSDTVSDEVLSDLVCEENESNNENTSNTKAETCETKESNDNSVASEEKLSEESSCFEDETQTKAETCETKESNDNSVASEEKLSEQSSCFEDETQIKDVQRLQLPVLPSGTQTCYASHVSSLDNLYLQLSDQETGLEELSAELNGIFAGDTGSPLDNPAIGQECCCQFSEDGSWYRAYITSIDDNKAAVTFLDYGNSDVVELSSLKSPVKHLQCVPAFSWKCRLGHVKPVVGKEKEANELFLTLTKETELEAAFSSINGSLIVSLSSEAEGDIAQKLKEKGLVVEETTEGVNLQDNSSCLSLPPVVIPNDDEICFVSNSGQGPNRFFLQLASQEETLTEFNLQVGQAYSAKPDDVKDLAPGVLCCAQFSLDDAWYRARVLSVDEEDIKVMFLDYGNIETVARSSLCLLLPQFTSQPPFAYECCMSGLKVVPGEEESALQHFVDLTQDKELTVTFQSSALDQIFHVKLSDQDGDLTKRLLNHGLISESVLEDKSQAPKRAKQDNSSVDRQNEPIETSRTETSLESNLEQHPDLQVFVEDKDSKSTCNDHETSDREIKNQDKHFMSVPVGQRLQVQVTHVISPQQFWIQLNDSVAELKQMTLELSEQLDNSETQIISDIKPGVMCAAHFSNDSSWYRCKVLTVEDNTVCLSFIDYGNCEEQEVSSLRNLGNKWESLPILAVECQLSGVTPQNGSDIWEEEVCYEFSEMVMKEGKLLTAEFISQDSLSGLADVKLLDMGLNVADVLVSKLLADYSSVQSVLSDEILKEDFQENLHECNKRKLSFSSNISGLDLPNISDFQNISSICGSTCITDQLDTSFVTDCTKEEDDHVFLESSRLVSLEDSEDKSTSASEAVLEDCDNSVENTQVISSDKVKEQLNEGKEYKEVPLCIEGDEEDSIKEEKRENISPVESIIQDTSEYACLETDLILAQENGSNRSHMGTSYKEETCLHSEPIKDKSMEEEKQENISHVETLIQDISYCQSLETDQILAQENGANRSQLGTSYKEAIKGIPIEEEKQENVSFVENLILNTTDYPNIETDRILTQENGANAAHLETNYESLVESTINTISKSMDNKNPINEIKNSESAETMDKILEHVENTVVTVNSIENEVHECKNEDPYEGHSSLSMPTDNKEVKQKDKTPLDVFTRDDTENKDVEVKFNDSVRSTVNTTSTKKCAEISDKETNEILQGFGKNENIEISIVEEPELRSDETSDRTYYTVCNLSENPEFPDKTTNEEEFIVSSTVHERTGVCTQELHMKENSTLDTLHTEIEVEKGHEHSQADTAINDSLRTFDSDVLSPSISNEESQLNSSKSDILSDNTNPVSTPGFVALSPDSYHFRTNEVNSSSPNTEDNLHLDVSTEYLSSQGITSSSPILSHSVSSRTNTSDDICGSSNSKSELEESGENLCSSTCISSSSADDSRLHDSAAYIVTEGLDTSKNNSSVLCVSTDLPESSEEDINYTFDRSSSDLNYSHSFERPNLEDANTEVCSATQLQSNTRSSDTSHVLDSLNTGEKTEVGIAQYESETILNETTEVLESTKSSSNESGGEIINGSKICRTDENDHINEDKN